MGSREELGAPSCCRGKARSRCSQFFPCLACGSASLAHSPAPSPVGTGAGLVCQQTPMRCCFDMISQIFADSTAGLEGRTTVKRQVCVGRAEGGGALSSSGTFMDRCCSPSCCCWAQRPASLLLALNIFLLEFQQDFCFPVGYFPAASAQVPQPGLAVCMDQQPDQAQAALLQRGVSGQMPQTQCPLLCLEAPQPLPGSCCHAGSPHGTPESSRRSRSPIMGGTGLGGDGRGC